DLGTLSESGAKSGSVDNPRFRAPEFFPKGTTSPQSDAFAIGASAYAAMNEEEFFHYGDEKVIGGLLIAKISKTIEAYGQIESEEGAIALEDEENPAVTRGEDGSTVIDPKRTAARTKFTEFMNLLLHPDPSKRLSPKQALEHPFLSEKMLSDDQVKGVIKRLGQAPLDE
ncbi:MAG: hypothetical protein JO317_09350, partial [Verrucomicrobiae bacterium]|nr:hypothetical protein [Verrucomicrobiae bacterium]